MRRLWHWRCHSSGRTSAAPRQNWEQAGVSWRHRPHDPGTHHVQQPHLLQFELLRGNLDSRAIRYRDVTLGRNGLDHSVPGNQPESGGRVSCTAVQDRGHRALGVQGSRVLVHA